MKKRILLLTILAFILSACLVLSSCDKPNTDEGNEPPTAEYVTVTFDTNGGSAIDSVQVEAGKKVTQPQDPQKEGYIFDGWYLGNEKWSFVGYVVTENMTLTAKWTPKMLTVTFDTNGGSAIDSVQVIKGEKVTQPQDPQREGYTFDGWHLGNEKWSFVGYVVTENMTLTAKWTKEEVQEPTPEYVTVTFNTNGGSAIDSVQVEVGKKVTQPQDPQKEGYTFDGWYIDGENWSFVDYAVTENMTLTAKWTPITYTITYVGDVTHSNKKTYTVEDESFDLTGIGKTYYEFLGWYEDEEFTKQVTKIEKGTVGNKTLYAKTEYIPVVLELDGDSYKVVGYDKKTANVVISSTYKGKNVTSIGDEAFRNCTSLTSVSIPNSVTSIGNGAFYGCYSLTSITIPFVGATLNGTSNTHFGYIFGASSYSDNGDYVPSSLKEVIITGGNSIGDNAFYECESLTSVTIGDSVTSIGNSAFAGCKSLTSITIGDSVTSIGNSAFGSCYNLTRVTIGDSVTSIGNYAFRNCTSLVSIMVDENNKAYKSIDGNLYTYDEKTLVQYAIGKTDKEFAIPNSVTSIGEYAFADCESLTSVSIGDSVTSIGNDAFYNCESLTSVTIPDSVTSIGNGAFSVCTSLTSIEIPNSVTSIGYSAFYVCTSLTIYCEAKSKPYRWDTNWNYSNCPVVWNCNNKYVANDGYIYTVIDGVRYGIKDGKATVVRQPENIKEAIIKESITYKNASYPVARIGSDAFDGCYNLTSVTIPNSVTSIGGAAFAWCTRLNSVTIPNSVTSIGGGAFRSCTGLTSIEIPNSVTSIGDSAFYHCTNLTSITIGDGVTSISISAFSGCTRLTSIEIPNSVTRIGNYAFSGCTSLTSVSIGDSVTSIGERTFSGCTSLTSIEIPNSVTSIGSYAFLGCTSLVSIMVDENNKAYKSIDGNLYTYDEKTLVLYAIGKTDKEFAIPNSVTSIGYSAFSGCTSLTSVTIGDSVTSIGYSAFYYCISLTSITIPNSVTSIGNEAFSSCTSLTIYCEATSKPSGWNSKWNSSNCPVVWNCNNNDVANDGYIYTVIDGVRYSIKDVAATVATQPENIKEAIIKESITYKNVSYPVTSIGKSAFYRCYNLTSVTIGNSVTSIGNEAFYNCTSLTSVSIPNSVTSIGEKAFYDCTSLTSITIPDSVTSIGNWTFENCTNLTIYCEATSKPSGWNTTWNNSKCPVVWNCNNNDVANDGYIYTVIDGVRYSIKDGAATVATQPRNIKEAIIKESITYKNASYPVTSIGYGAFSYCNSLTSITIPNSVTSIGNVAFRNCTHLTSIEIPNSVTSIGKYAFEDCTSLTSVSIGDSVTSIGERTFSGCTSLTSIEIPNSVTRIGSDAFDGCTSLTSITIGDGVTSISISAFSGCTSLTSIEIPNSVTSIGNYAFSSCTSLTSIEIPDSVTSIGKNAFSNCTSLTIYCEATSQPDGWVTKWNYSKCPVVWNCNNNEVANDGYIYTLIDGVRYSIKDGAAAVARQPDNIKEAIIKESITYKNVSYPVTSIGDDAFADCESLTSVTIPNSVTSIGNEAFRNCTRLTSIEIPNSVTSIGNYTFDYCTSLTSVSIGDSVTSIGYGAFSYCNSLTIYCETQSKPSGWSSSWNYSNRPVVWGYKQGE